MKKLYSELLEVAKTDADVAHVLLQRGEIIHSLFYLSQSFEKANKSLLALIKEKFLNEDRNATEEYLSKRIGHDKKRATKEIIDFFKRKEKEKDFNQIKDELPKFIKPYKHFTSVKEFHSRINEDFIIYTELRESSRGRTSFLHQKYAESKFYEYQIVSYILRRYYNDIETHIRYPTSENNFSIKNPFNEISSKDALNKLSIMTKDLVNVVSSILETPSSIKDPFY